MEERHWKIAGQVDLVLIETDVHGKGFDEVFPIVAIVKGARAEEQCQRSIDGRVPRVIPVNAKTDAAKFDGLRERSSELQRPKH